MNQQPNKLGKLSAVTDKDISDAKAVGFQVQQGDASHGAELEGRWWWTLSQPGWLEVQTSQCDFDNETQAWAYAVRFLRGDSTLSRKLADAPFATMPGTPDPVTVDASVIADVELCILAAQEHGVIAAPEHEVDDLQKCVREMWVILSPAQRRAFMQSAAVRVRLEGNLPDELITAAYTDPTHPAGVDATKVTDADGDGAPDLVHRTQEIVRLIYPSATVTTMDGDEETIRIDVGNCLLGLVYRDGERFGANTFVTVLNWRNEPEPVEVCKTGLVSLSDACRTLFGFTNERAPSMLSGVSGDEQQSSHANGTLQSAGNTLELTIATTLDIPHAYTALGERKLIDYVSARLGFAVALLPDLKFDVVIGPAGRD